jgi:hypothetical protein
MIPYQRIFDMASYQQPFYRYEPFQGYIYRYETISAAMLSIWDALITAFISIEPYQRRL